MVDEKLAASVTPPSKTSSWQQDVRAAPKDSAVENILSGESFRTPLASLGHRHDQGDQPLKWTAVRYRAKPEQADENQRLSEAVFRELAARSPAGLAYEVLRLADGTFVHIAAIEDGAQPVSALESFRAFRSGIEDRCLEPPKAGEATVVGRYRMLTDGAKSHD
ncbi:MAG TPA: hypothetical protein VG224_08980 [Reyranella sp.]|jgi:hypothetical protein|nr:hypothetical protein [Reyranella sp.]